MSWPSVRLSRVIVGIKDGTHGTYERISVDGLPLLSAKNVRDSYLQIGDNESLISEIDHKSIIASGFPRRGDVLLTIVGTIGRSAVFREPKPLAFQRSVCFVRPGTQMNSDFLNYSFQAKDFQEHLKLRSKTSAQPGVYLGDVMDCRIPLPSMGMQTQITRFLDAETGKVDELIAKQKRLIELLAEKRQAIITQAVTKGFNPSAPTKPSGIPWLGDVPSHWEVAALKHVLRMPITDGPHETPEFLDEGVPFVSAEAVSGGVINFSKIRGYISETDNDHYSRKYSPRRGDIYMVKSGATTGVTALVETDIKFNIWSPLAAIRCDDSMLPEFLLTFLRSRVFLDSVALHWSFGTQQNIGMRVLGDLPVVIPPLNEQLQLAEGLKLKFAKMDRLNDRCARSIELLKERRSALISAAVTGNVDVREGAA